MREIHPILSETLQQSIVVRAALRVFLRHSQVAYEGRARKELNGLTIRFPSSFSQKLGNGYLEDVNKEQLTLLVIVTGGLSLPVYMCIEWGKIKWTYTIPIPKSHTPVKGDEH